MLKILFIGDTVGKIGRQTLKKILPGIRREHKPDLIIANAENIAHGTGLSAATLEEAMDAGVDLFTSGDHAFDKEKGFLDCLNKGLPIIRPANYPSGVPGEGYKTFEAKDRKILVINLLGRVFMGMDYDCPFRKLDEILSNCPREDFSAIIIDIHAEATSEKVAFFHHADGRASAVLGTHTHVMTADGQVSKEGTAFLSDTGMVGFADGCIGIKKENILKTFLTQIKYPHEIPEAGRTIFNAILVSIDEKTGRALGITPIIKFTHIK